MRRLAREKTLEVRKIIAKLGPCFHRRFVFLGGYIVQSRKYKPQKARIIIHMPWKAGSCICYK